MGEQFPKQTGTAQELCFAGDPEHDLLIQAVTVYVVAAVVGYDGMGWFAQGVLAVDAFEIVPLLLDGRLVGVRLVGRGRDQLLYV